MTAAIPAGARAVMASRHEPPDSLELFCTPPWGTRGLVKHVLGKRADWSPNGAIAWDPCAGLRHMSDVLGDYFDTCHASDVFDYGYPGEVGSFIGADGLGGDRVKTPEGGVDWIIFNPPFSEAVAFVQTALSLARRGVAALVRSQWLEGVARYNDLFSVRPPAAIAQFVERLPMVKGRWDPTASTATSYVWVVWDVRRIGLPMYQWIPPGQRPALTHVDDVRRFAGRGVADASEGVAQP